MVPQFSKIVEHGWALSPKERFAIFLNGQWFLQGGSGLNQFLVSLQECKSCNDTRCSYQIDSVFGNKFSLPIDFDET